MLSSRSTRKIDGSSDGLISPSAHLDASRWIKVDQTGSNRIKAKKLKADHRESEKGEVKRDKGMADGAAYVVKKSSSLWFFDI